MWINSIKIANVRCFKKQHLILSRQINIFAGTNNSGKSTLIKSFALPEYENLFSGKDNRKNTLNGSVTLDFKDLKTIPGIGRNDDVYVRMVGKREGDFKNVGKIIFAHREPDNLIYPLFSHRKVQNYSQAVNEDVSTSIDTNLSNLGAKLYKITNQYHPNSEYFNDNFRDILGFNITSIPSGGGQIAAKYLSDTDYIPVADMGDGVPMIAGFLINLAISENKLFIIEEPEHDLHPFALKKLLELIIDSSQKNQFMISTHSNIVLRELGQLEETKIFHVIAEPSTEIPTSIVKTVDTPEGRLELLSELGYEFYDDECFNAWLFLEESSAERIIRDHLIRWFTPDIFGKIRTYSCDSVSKVKKRFKDFNKVFAYLHLEPKYKNRAWVLIDGGAEESEETKVIAALRETYVINNGWNESNFGQFPKHNFEEYYPDHFKDKVKEVEEESDKGKKRELKSKLVEDVCSWIDGNEDKAKEEFETSAAEVIVKLKEIEEALKRPF